MEEYKIRQISLMKEIILMYKNSEISLNTFIQKIEGLGSAIDNKDFSDKLFPIIVNLEQVNAFLIEEKCVPSESDKEIINAEVYKLDKLIDN
jgi:hypothetical protein